MFKFFRIHLEMEGGCSNTTVRVGSCPQDTELDYVNTVTKAS